MNVEDQKHLKECNGKKMMKEVTDVEWMVKRGIPRAYAYGAFNDIERLRKITKENPECLLM